MGMVKQFYMDYCEAMHPNDMDAQDRLFEQLCDGSVQVPPVEEVQAKIKKHKTWLEIQAFAKHMVGLTDNEVDVWAKHAIEGGPGTRCTCPACAKHTLYTHIVDALEQWEKRNVNPDVGQAREGDAGGGVEEH